MTPRDSSVSFEHAETLIRQQLAVTPDATLVDSDSKNRIMIIEASEGSVASLRETLGNELFIDPNAPLRF